jgi:hypothetical protein
MKWNMGMLGCEYILLFPAILTPNIFSVDINDGN